MAEYAGTRLAGLMRFRCRHTERRSVDRHRFVRVRGGRAAVQAVQRAGRRVRARRDDDSDHRADHEELLLLVPEAMREGALALGATRTRAVFSVVVPAALPGIITGIVLALARIAGETAPLLFTAFNNRFFSTSLEQPISTLTVQVFTYATGPYEDWHRQAWAGALVLVSIVLGCSLLARLATRRLERMHTRAGSTPLTEPTCGRPAVRPTGMRRRAIPSASVAASS
jgi:hypothetical protein